MLLHQYTKGIAPVTAKAMLNHGYPVPYGTRSDNGIYPISRWEMHPSVRSVLRVRQRGLCLALQVRKRLQRRVMPLLLFLWRFAMDRTLKNGDQTDLEILDKPRFK